MQASQVCEHTLEQSQATHYEMKPGKNFAHSFSDASGQQTPKFPAF